jgi:hypothetical protein
MSARRRETTPNRIEPWRETQLGILAAIRTGQIGDMTVEQLSAVRITPLSTLGDRLIEFPKAWLPSGALQFRSRRIIDLGKLASASHPVGSPTYQRARAVVLRMLLVLWVVPRHLARGTLAIKPSTYIGQCQILIQIARLALEMGQMSGGTLFAGLSHDAALAVMNSPGLPKSTSRGGLLRALFHLSKRGIIGDWVSETALSITAPDATAERNRRGDPVLRSENDDKETWQPLPDLFVTEFGWRCLWFMENLGPGLIDCYSKCSRESVRRKSHSEIIANRLRHEEIILSYDWRSTGGGRIDNLPFEIEMVGQDEENGNLKRATAAWPPRYIRPFRRCIGFLQTCHIVVVLLTTGARWSEVAGLTRQCLETEQPDDHTPRLEGRTWKLVDGIGGAVRDWPLHPLAVKAIKQQISLAEKLRPKGGHLWVPMRETWSEIDVESLDQAADHLQSFAIATGAAQFLSGTALHPHRFRKTVARLAALALVGAPKILMDLFGHKSIEMTLRYILSDPSLAAEIDEVAKAQVIMLGEQAVANVDRNGGPAAKTLKAGLSGAMRGDRKPLGAEDIREAAEILTMQGKSALLVRPNVLCTKGPREAGPCTKNVGHPDPSRCKAHCGHRLEVAAARDDVDKAISQCVAMLHDAAVTDDEMQWAFWRGQLMHHIARFEDIGEKWRRFPDVMRFIGEGIAA